MRIFCTFIPGAIMQDGPLIEREDVTVSLDRELIGKIVGIAEIRGTTLSALVRDILGAYCRAYHAGSDWIRTTPQSLRSSDLSASVGSESSGVTSLADVQAWLSRHDELFAVLEQRISFLELTDGVSSRSTPVQVRPSIPLVMQTTLSPGSAIAEVIDSEAPVIGDISDEALVKIRKPVSPVITSVDVSSIGRITPDQDYSLTEAAALLSISSSTIRKYVKDGRLASRKIGRNTVFKGQDLLFYLGQSR
jgi:excisionase family DNA binding protein